MIETSAGYNAREYQPSDRNDLIAMYAVFEPKRAAQGLPPAGEGPIGIWLDRVLKRGRHLVVHVDEILRGHIMLVPMEDGSLELANFLHQSVRNRGIGTALNALVIRLARESGWAPEIEMAAELLP